MSLHNCMLPHGPDARPSTTRARGADAAALDRHHGVHVRDALSAASDEIRRRARDTAAELYELLAQRPKAFRPDQALRAAMEKPDRTHDPRRKSWVESANLPTCDVPIQNLPFGIFSRGPAHAHAKRRCGIAIGDQHPRRRGTSRILSKAPRAKPRVECEAPALNAADAARPRGAPARCAFPCRGFCRMPAHRHAVRTFPGADGRGNAASAGGDFRLHRFLFLDLSRHQCRPHFPARQSAAAQLQMGAHRLSRPRLVDPRQRPRASAGRWARPRRPMRDAPGFGPSRQLDYELELGFYIGTGNDFGKPVPHRAGRRT